MERTRTRRQEEGDCWRITALKLTNHLGTSRRSLSCGRWLSRADIKQHKGNKMQIYTCVSRLHKWGWTASLKALCLRLGVRSNVNQNRTVLSQSPPEPGDVIYIKVKWKSHGGVGAETLHVRRVWYRFIWTFCRYPTCWYCPNTFWKKFRLFICTNHCMSCRHQNSAYKMSCNAAI